MRWAISPVGSPDLAEFGTRQPEVGRELAKILGPRGEWLGRAQPALVGVARLIETRGLELQAVQPNLELS
jgi:hypothetical protein